MLLRVMTAVASIPLMGFATDQFSIGTRASKVAPAVFDRIPDDASEQEYTRAIDAAAEPGQRATVQHYGHWSAMATFTLAIVALAAIAALRPAGRRVPAWSAGIMAAHYGMASQAYPNDASANAGIWGFLAVAWASDSWLLPNCSPGGTPSSPSPSRPPGGPVRRARSPAELLAR